MSDVKPNERDVLAFAERDIDDAHRLARREFGGELYAAAVLPIARILAAHRAEITAEVLKPFEALLAKSMRLMPVTAWARELADAIRRAKEEP